MIKVGIIGCGKIAQVRHLPEYADNPYCEIAAVFDVNGERAKEMAEKYNARVYDSYEELLNDSAIDAVSICTSNIVHASITIAALNAKKHVLCEKPMAVTLEDCEKMVAVSKKNNRFLMIGQNQRLARAHVYAKRLLQNNEIGKVIRFHTEFSHAGPETWSVDPGSDVWFFNKQTAVMGAMADLGIHKTDLIQFLLNDYITKVTAQMTTLDKCYSNGDRIGVDDNSICIYEMSKGCIGTMTASWTNYGKENNATILYGTEGVMKIYDDPEYSIIVEKKNGEKILYDIDQIQTNDNQTKSGVIDAWIDSIRNNIQPDISGESVLNSMRVVFAAMESAEKGKTIEIGES
ncbi:MAG: Gfo/Idh/MocA family oxidoreductase [Lachnospiraceae bacterium]|nr:Gfo/Idh/MocA family oxidoreductase [Lachnospiraceae bacterium]